jgi:hypothetical protein
MPTRRTRSKPSWPFAAGAVVTNPGKLRFHIATLPFQLFHLRAVQFHRLRIGFVFA